MHNTLLSLYKNNLKPKSSQHKTTRMCLVGQAGIVVCAAFAVAVMGGSGLAYGSTVGSTLEENPAGGWRNGKTQQVYSQDVYYPASSVNLADGQDAAIAGRVAQSIARQQKTTAAETTNAQTNTKNKKDKKDKIAPHTLIVNGVAMPLAVDETGRYARPYSFGKGSNSVQINAPNGATMKRVQFYDANTKRAVAKLRVLLSWDTDGTDLDLHVVTPSGQHAYYGNRVVKGGGALDVDVTTGYGPEIFSHPAPEKGQYLVFVNYYGSRGGADDMTTANISVITNENTASEKQETFAVPMRKAGELLLVKRFVMP